jgi:tRNA pseudouridine55 synthase
MTKPFEAAGLILLNKPSGLTSFTSLNRVKRAFSTGKVGHIGTLDKFAHGLLVALLGRAVKLSPWFSGCDKWYEGIIRFGLETDTLDPEGAPVAEAALPSREQLEAALPAFHGDILQEPPVYSALHINGKRASVLARGGKTVTMRKRPVSIYALELLTYEPPLACIRVHCSSGTYIRSLARDIALAAASRGHLVSLTRTAVAGFCLSDALADDDPALIQAALRPIDTQVFAALKIPVLTVSDETACSLTQGKSLTWLNVEINGDTLAVFRHDHSFVGIVERTGGVWHYGYMWPA